MLLPHLSEKLVFALGLKESPLCSKPVFWPKETEQNIELCTQADAQGARKYWFCIHVLKQEDFLEIRFRRACESHELSGGTSTLDLGFYVLYL